jgi:hypothetical protein
MKKIPVDIADFRRLHEDNYIYVDKTDLLEKLINSKIQVFLSRPRRFGKSLILNTLELIFQGNADLFAGLAIAKKGYKFEKYPVIHLDMSQCDTYTPEVLITSLLEQLKDIGIFYDINVSNVTINGVLRNVVNNLQKKYGQRVVVLIDEYDDPVSSKINSPRLAKANTEILRQFYSSLKSLQGRLRFVMVTGVTRYSMMGLSAGLNHLYDISFEADYSTICGFTPQEVDRYFGYLYGSALERLIIKGQMPQTSSKDDLRQKILDWYDGYSWDGKTRVLNPISILNFFEKVQFSTYWARTGSSSTLLSNITPTNPLPFTRENLEDVSLDTILATTTIDDIDPLSLLFYTGYLTIATFTEDSDKFFLKMPNYEVKKNFFDVLSRKFRNLFVADDDKSYSKFNEIIRDRDASALSTYIEGIYFNLPHQHHQPTESHYHSVLWAYFFGLIQDPNRVGIEIPKFKGDLDLLLILKDSDQTHVLIEFKYHYDDSIFKKEDEKREYIKGKLLSEAKTALSSIKEKNYAEPYRRLNKKVVEVGVGIYGRGLVLACFGEER